MELPRTNKDTSEQYSSNSQRSPTLAEIEAINAQALNELQHKYTRTVTPPPSNPPPGRKEPVDVGYSTTLRYPSSSDISLRRDATDGTLAMKRVNTTEDDREDDEDAVIDGVRENNKDFDWEADHDDSSHFDKSVSSQRQQRCFWWQELVKKLPYWLQCLMNAIIGDLLIFGILGVPDLIFGIIYDEPAPFPGGPNVAIPFSEWTSRLSIGGMPLLHWSIYFIISWTLHYVTLFALSIVPTLLQRIFGIALGSRFEEQLSEYLNYFRVLHFRITISVWIILSNLIWIAFVIAPDWGWRRIYDESHGPPGWRWYNYIQRILVTMFVVYALWTIEKLILEIIATRFHRKAFKSRIKDFRQANEYLEAILLSIRAPRARMPMDYELANQVPGSGKPPSFAVLAGDQGTVDSGGMMNHNAQMMNKVFNRAGQFIAKQANKTVAELAKQAKLDPHALASASAIPKTRGRANLVARDLFSALVKPEFQYLTVDDFRAYFSSDEETQRAFVAFDINRSGDISKSEMKSILNQWTQEKKDIENSIADVTSAVSSLNYFLGAVFIFLMVIICSNNIWEVPTDRYLSTLAAVLLPGTFIFGATLKETFECIIFLFAQHYFDVGDLIRFDKEYYRVVAMSILTTTLRRSDGKIVYAPNDAIQKKVFDNVRRSGCMSEDIIIKVDINTTNEQMDFVKGKMMDFLKENSFDYKASFNWLIKEIILSEGAMRCEVSIDHTSNWQAPGARHARRNKFMFALRGAIMEAGISCPVTGVPEYYDR